MEHPGTPAAAQPRRKRLRERDATVVEVVRETRDAVTLVLATPEPAEYAAGQFLTIDPHQFDELADLLAYFEEAKGRREPPRAYSMCSSPLERDVAVTVKQEHYVRGTTRYPPVLSPYLARRVAAGQRVRVVGFTGAYVLPPDVEDRTDHLVHVVAGSGSVPNYAILKYALAVHPRLRHTFLYSNKTWDDVIFREALAALEERFPERLRVVHTLTREPDPGARGLVPRSVPTVRSGRVTPALLREAVGDPAASLVYACGPANGSLERAAARERGESPAPRFLETVLAGLAEVGVPRDHVKTESWG